MHSLASYIRAIHALPSPVSISDAQVEEQQRCEDGVEIHSCEALYRFDNGVRLRQHCERDLLPSSGACEECWIGYEVLDSAGQEISHATSTSSTPARNASGCACTPEMLRQAARFGR